MSLLFNFYVKCKVHFFHRNRRSFEHLLLKRVIFSFIELIHCELADILAPGEYLIACHSFY